MSGSPLHHDSAWPGTSNSTITRTPRSREYSTISATSACVYRCDGMCAAFHSFGCDLTSNGNDCVSTMCQCNTFSFA